MIEGKRCPRCGETQPLNNFGNSKQTKSGKNGWCLTCCREVSKAYRLTPNGVFNQLKGRNNFYKRHMFSISNEEFVNWYEDQPKVCHYCGVPEEHMEYVMSYYGSRWLRFTVDCKDNDAGYINGNLVLACDKCNSVKSNILTYDDMLYVGETFIKPKWQALIIKPTTKIEEE